MPQAIAAGLEARRLEPDALLCQLGAGAGVLRRSSNGAEAMARAEDAARTRQACPNGSPLWLWRRAAPFTKGNRREAASCCGKQMTCNQAEKCLMRLPIMGARSETSLPLNSWYFVRSELGSRLF